MFRTIASFKQLTQGRGLFAKYQTTNLFAKYQTTNLIAKYQITSLFVKYQPSSLSRYKFIPKQPYYGIKYYSTYGRLYYTFSVCAALCFMMMINAICNEEPIVIQHINWNKYYTFDCKKCKRPNISKYKHEVRCQHCSHSLFVEDKVEWRLRRGVKTMTNFCPFLGPFVRIAVGFRTGNLADIARGYLSFVGDVVTLDGFSVVLENILDYAPVAFLIGGSLADDEPLDAFEKFVGLGISIFIDPETGQVLKTGIAAMKILCKTEYYIGFTIGGKDYKKVRLKSLVKLAIRDICKYVGCNKKQQDYFIDMLYCIEKVYEENNFELDLANSIYTLRQMKINAWSTKSIW